MGKIINRVRQRERATQSRRAAAAGTQFLQRTPDYASVVEGTARRIAEMQADSGRAMTIRLYGYVAAAVVWVLFCAYWIIWGL